MKDATTPNIRERVWVTVVDHTQDPPQPVEEIFIENGNVQSRRRLNDQPTSDERTRDE
jgi:hypothetical protein